MEAGVTYAYLANSSMIEGYTLGDLKRTVTYEPNRNLVDAVTNTWNTATTLSAFDYTNDAAGRRTARADSGTAFTSTLANVFGYNVRNEVTSATMRNGNSTYNFDQIGNRTQVSVPDEPDPVDYVSNALNQYTAIGDPVAQPAYDLDGNMTSDGEGKTLTWNAENRMIKVEDGDITVENTYDAMGQGQLT